MQELHQKKYEKISRRKQKKRYPIENHGVDPGSSSHKFFLNLSVS
jgi:hypothetical protein